MASITIHKHANGYAVHARDPGADKHNAKPTTRYADPHKTFVFKSKDDVHGWMKDNMDKALHDPDADAYDSAFSKASAASTKEKAK